MILLLGLAGMGLVLLSHWMTPAPKEEKESIAANAAMDSGQILYTPEAYVSQIEGKLSDLLGAIQGVGRVHIMVTLENSGEYVYALEEKRSWDKNTAPDSSGVSRENLQQSYILVDVGYGQKEPLVRTRLEPKIQGVVVICQGGGDIRVRQSVVNVVTTALKIPSIRVCVEQAQAADPAFE